MLGDSSIGELALAEGDLFAASTPSQSATAEFAWSVSPTAEFVWTEGEIPSSFGWS